MRSLLAIVGLFISVVSSLKDDVKFYHTVYSHKNTEYMVIVEVDTPRDKTYFLIGSSNPPSPLCAMILRGGTDSNITVSEDIFFSKHVNNSIITHGITESHGLLIYNLCDYKDKAGAATFANYQNADCKNSGENLHWSHYSNESTYEPTKFVLVFKSSKWDPPKNVEHHGVQFTFTVSLEKEPTLVSNLPFPQVRGFAVDMEFSEPLEMPYSRLGLGMLVYTNSSIHSGQKFVQERIFDFGVELEPGNFLSTVVQLDKRDPPEGGRGTSSPPAYLYWRDVCSVGRKADARASTWRRLVAFQGDPVGAHHKDNQRINRSLPQALFGPTRFNIHVHTNDTVATKEIWLGFGSPGDGFYAATNFTAWSFVMGLGNAPVEVVGGVGRLFAPLLVPLVALAASLAYFYQRQLCGARAGGDANEEDGEEGATRPLITEIGEDDGGDHEGVYPGFASSSPDGRRGRGIAEGETGDETTSQTNDVAA